MIFLLRTLSVSYLRRHFSKVALAVVGIAIGVATFVSIKTAQQTLVAGFRSTIDRLAGGTQIQVTGVGGVPEELLETLRALPDIAVQEPVIEQVVQPQPATLGTLLVFAVDLVGDRGLRDYSFSGDDADVDDPLVFLAQPDSVALSREFAERAGLRKGDTLTVRFGGVTRRLAVRALLEPKGFSRAYGGNVAITDVYAAQALFGRGRRFDRIDIKLKPAAGLDSGLAAVARAAGPGYTVQTPERRGAEVERLVGSFVNAFDVLGVVALGIGLYMIFNVFTIAVQRRRRDIGILRAEGATPRQVRVLFLCEAAIVGAFGSALGIALGTVLADRFLQLMGAVLTATYGMSESAAATVSSALTVRAMAVGVAASLVGAYMPALEAGRVPPTSAIATGAFAVRAPIGWMRVVVGFVLLGLAYVIGRFHLITGPSVIFIVSGCGAIGTTVLAGPAARAVIRPLVPLLAWIAPAAGRIAADALLGHPKRTAGTAAVLSVSMAFVLGTAGYLQAVRVSVREWVGNVVTADLVVRASNGIGPSAVRLPGSARATLAEVPGVEFVDTYRNEHIVYRDQNVALVAIGGATRMQHQFVAGGMEAFKTGLGRGQCVVSDNFSRRFHLGVGDTVTLDSPTGPINFPIAAVVINFVSDRGTILVDPAIFAARWQNEQVDAFYVTLRQGVSPAQARDDVRARLANAGPAVISTRAEFIEELDRALDAFQVLIRAVVMMVLVIALMGVMTSLWVSTIERTRDVGILKAIGAKHRQLAGAVICEAVTLVLASLALGAPLGSLLSWFLRDRVSQDYAGFRFAASYPIDTLALILVALPLVAIAGAWLPARWAANLRVVDAVAYE